jgi:hypothetical protein
VRLRACCLVLALAAAVSTGVSAHHSAASTYDAAESMVVRGRVIGFAWTNPHCHVYVDVTDGAFKGRTFTVELASPAALTSEGWTKSAMHPGDHVTIAVNPARAGTPNGLCRRCAMTLNGKSFPWRPGES